jgi:hypothetical protein
MFQKYSALVVCHFSLQEQWQLDILNNIEFIPSAALYALG